MKRKNSLFEIASLLTLIGQFGISLILPILLFTFLGVYLNNRFELGAWIVIVMVIVGILTAASTFYQFAKKMIWEATKDDKPKEKEEKDDHKL